MFDNSWPQWSTFTCEEEWNMKVRSVNDLWSFNLDMIWRISESSVCCEGSCSFNSVHLQTNRLIDVSEATCRFHLNYHYDPLWTRTAVRGFTEMTPLHKYDCVDNQWRLRWTNESFKGRSGWLHDRETWIDCDQKQLPDWIRVLF